MTATRNQLAIGAALTTLAAQAVAYGTELPQGMQWVAVVASTLAALWMGAKSPSSNG